MPQIWTFNLSIQGLDQLHDYVSRSHDPLLRIIHILENDVSGWNDHYICLVECDAPTASLLSLYE